MSFRFSFDTHCKRASSCCRMSSHRMHVPIHFRLSWLVVFLAEILHTYLIIHAKHIPKNMFPVLFYPRYHPMWNCIHENYMRPAAVWFSQSNGALYMPFNKLGSKQYTSRLCTFGVAWMEAFCSSSSTSKMAADWTNRLIFIGRLGHDVQYMGCDTNKWNSKYTEKNKCNFKGILVWCVLNFL